MPYLVAELGSSDEELIVSVLEALGRIGAAEAEDAVLSLVQDDRLRVRRAAIKALGCLGLMMFLGPLLEAGFCEGRMVL